ncbi:DUF551 domain-containing protein [Psychrobacter pocilloporae]|uniref:DUF551 domain-containing protein n=1 Tax=Psychrobacter pocilloporae TaxID=1775882 RepID=UPI003C2BF546
MNNLQPLKWHEQEGWFSTKSPLTEYRITTSIDKYKVFYTKRADKFTREATGFATIDEAKTWCWNHYNEKMQPYVASSPTWISVDKQLPEMHKRVIIKADCYLIAARTPKTEHNKDWGISGDWIWSIVNDNWCDAHMVTHWMPIPEFKQGE